MTAPPPDSSNRSVRRPDGSRPGFRTSSPPAHFDPMVFFHRGNWAAAMRDAVPGNNTNDAFFNAKIRKFPDKTVEKHCETIHEMESTNEGRNASARR